MWGRVMVEFGRGEELHTFSWVIGAEDVEIGLELLIGSFGLSIGLRMVGSGELYSEQQNCSNVIYIWNDW